MEDYSICRPIGSGAQGSVLSVKHIPTGRKFAMKVIRCHDISAVNTALKEIKVLLQLRYPHIVSYEDFFLVSDTEEVTRLLSQFTTNEINTSVDSQGYAKEAPLDATRDVANDSRSGSENVVVVSPNEICVCLVMELCIHGDMGMVIRKSKRKFVSTALHPIKENQIVSWMKQCVSALKYIHEKKFLHRDLKPTNIFLDADENIKIGDFGLAVAVGMSRQGVVGTPMYIAPEHMLEQDYNEKVDVWGLGVVMLELTTLREQSLNSQLIDDASAVECVTRQVTSMGFSGRLGELLRDMLHRSPGDRPSLHDISRRLGEMGGAVTQVGGCGSTGANFVRATGPSRVVLWVDEECGAGEMSTPSKVSGVQSCRDSERASRGGRSCSSFERTSHSAGCSSRTTRTHWLRDDSSSAARTLKWRMSSASSVSSRLLTPRHTAGGEITYTASSATHSVGSGVCDLLNLSARRTLRDTTIRVPKDYPTLVAALQAVKQMPHVRKIVVADTTVLDGPLILGSGLPDNLCIMGEDPSPVIEVSDGPCAVRCTSGRGTIENFVIQHNSRQTPKECVMEAGAASGSEKTISHLSAISVVGGEWKVSRCLISSVSGSGVTVNYGAEAIVSRCEIYDVKTAGIIVLEKARGLFEKNTLKNCKLAGFLLKKDSTACVRGNSVANGSVTGVFLHNAHGFVEENHIANNGSFGVVAKGPCANAVLRRNRIVANQKAGIFCCAEAAPIIVENDIFKNNRAGILIKERASPNVSRNIIHRGKEAGIYVFQDGAGVIEENEILNNLNAGIVVTTNGCPHVMRNKIQGNRYEGVWVCKGGGGTYLDNDLRGNAKGARDIEDGCSVHWISNREV